MVRGNSRRITNFSQTSPCLQTQTIAHSTREIDFKINHGWCARICKVDQPTNHSTTPFPWMAWWYGHHFKKMFNWSAKAKRPCMAPLPLEFISDLLQWRDWRKLSKMSRTGPIFGLLTDTFLGKVNCCTVNVHDNWSCVIVFSRYSNT